MEEIEFPQDFSEFLKLLNAHHVEYLLIGGFAVAIYGYPRTTADMDIWVARRRTNTERLVSCLRELGIGRSSQHSPVETAEVSELRKLVS